MYRWPWGLAAIQGLPFPFAVFTLSLASYAVIISIGERLRFALMRMSPRRWVACHLLAIVGPFAISLGILVFLRAYEG